MAKSPGREEHRRRPAHGSARVRLAAASVGSLALPTLVVATALASETRLGAPGYWPWLLTVLQVYALWAAGTRRWWGWLLGGAVQPVWIAYALVTGQLGFIPGCLVSAVVQANSFLRLEQREEAHRSRRRLLYA